MRILFLLQEFPYPPSNGVRLKIFELLGALSSEHECHLLSFGEAQSDSQLRHFIDECPRAKVLGIFPPREESIGARLYGWAQYGLPSAGPYSTRQFRDAMRQALATTRYDLIHVDMINLVQYADLAGDRRVLLSVNDAVSLGYLRTARHSAVPARLRLELAARVISSYERRAYRGRVVHVVAQADREYLRQLCPSARLEVVPLAVNPRYFKDPCYTRNGGPKIIAVPSKFALPGAIEETLRFLKAARRLLKDGQNEVEFHLLGPGGSPNFNRALAGQKNVKYLGWVEDYSETLSRSDVIVFPETAGAGTKNRHLQALAAGKPVIMSEDAAEGLAVVPGRHCLVGQAPEQLAECLGLVLDDKERATNIGAAGRAFVEAHHSPRAVGRKWEELYQSLRQAPNCALRSNIPVRTSFSTDRSNHQLDKQIDY